MGNKKTYFVSDIHLGLRAEKQTLDRDRLFARWLSGVSKDAESIYILGDLFDYWYEYKTVAPRGFTRVLGKLAELADSGINIHIFPGNHDLWMFDYFEKELGAIVHHKQPYEVEIEGKKFLMGHGDGLGPGDKGYKFLRKIFTCRFLQFLYAMIHPRISMGFAHRWSKHSRLSKGVAFPFQGEDEQIYKYAQDILKEKQVDYFVFGHRHTPVMMKVEDKSTLIILGEWIQGREYGTFDGEKFKMKKFD
ncbi:MAG: UDP-2,3-diacylglucosamine diphosphatase [Prevotellaceae bacterium]|jgi:UDP-2,3-diacylglucosamine hydrolase|nr:UDP-2,3-diacylglucosamine diphosphatase [Prevotellaceae bacterium]